MTDKDMKYLSNLASSSSDTSLCAESRDQLTHKLLYLLLEEMAATRRASRDTNKILEEMNHTLKETNKHLARLAKATTAYNREGDVAFRTHKVD